MSPNINKAIDIASHAALDPYMNDGGLEDIIRAALNAVGPWIAAQALRDAADLYGRETPGPGPWGVPSFEHQADWLRVRADEIEAQ